MELLIAFLMAFGIINAKEASTITTTAQAQKIVDSNNLQKDCVIWEVEGDDF